MAHEPRKKPLDFDGNPDHVTLGVRLGQGTVILCTGRYVLPGICLTWGTGIRGLMRGMATLPKVTRSY